MTKLAWLIIGGILAFLLATVGFFGYTYVHYANFGNQAEKALVASHTNLSNVMGSGHQQISGVAQAAGMAKDDLREVFTAAITAREGVDGSKAIMKMVTEHNPNVDPGLYREIQNVVKATKKELQAAQTAFLTQKALYETNLGYVWTGFWMKTAGYPKVDLASLKIAVTGGAVEAYRTGVDADIKLR